MQFDVEQQQFFLAPDHPPSSAQWQIPLCFRTSAGDSSCRLITEPKTTISAGKCGAWAFANRDAKGYYRVAYTPETVAALGSAASSSLTAPERITLVEDTWAMVRAGKSPVDQFLDLALAMKAEDNRVAANLLESHLQYLGSSLVTEAQAEKYRGMLRAQLAPRVDQLGWESRPADTDDQRTLRASLLSSLGGANDPAAMEAAGRITADYMRSAASVDGTLAQSALSVAAAHGDRQLYEQFLAAAQRAGNSEQVDHYLFALADFRDPALVERTLSLIESGVVRQQNYPALFSALLRNPASRNAAWNYLKAHWGTLSERITSFGGSGAVSALGNFCSAEQRNDITHFFETNRAPGAERALRQSIERIDNCIEFRRIQQDSMSRWLAAH
jgi:aminopeptidase N